MSKVIISCDTDLHTLAVSVDGVEVPNVVSAYGESDPTYGYSVSFTKAKKDGNMSEYSNVRYHYRNEEEESESSKVEEAKAKQSQEIIMKQLKESGILDQFKMRAKS